MNMLSRVREGGSTGRILEEYWYDHDGRRFMKIHYLPDGRNQTTYYPFPDYETTIDENGVREDIKYVFANGERIAKIYENGSKVYYLNDHLGSSSVLVDEEGNELERIQYYPFGAVKSGGVEKYGYNNKELDDTGLLYYGARYYNPSLRRWTQPDSVIPVYLEPQSLNRYSYVVNNPLVYTDPEGNIYVKGVKRSLGKFIEGGSNIAQGGVILVLTHTSGPLAPAGTALGGAYMVDGAYECVFSAATGLSSALIDENNMEAQEQMDKTLVVADHVTSTFVLGGSLMLGQEREQAYETTEDANNFIDGVQFVTYNTLIGSDSGSLEDWVIVMLEADETEDGSQAITDTQKDQATVEQQDQETVTGEGVQDSGSGGDSDHTTIWSTVKSWLPIG